MRHLEDKVCFFVRNIFPPFVVICKIRVSNSANGAFFGIVILVTECGNSFRFGEIASCASYDFFSGRFAACRSNTFYFIVTKSVKSFRLGEIAS
jgi:hypothetical protein